MSASKFLDRYPRTLWCSQLKTIVANQHNKHALHGRGSAYSKNDAERFLRHLVLTSILVEEIVITVQQHVVSYVRPGPQHQLVLQDRLKVTLPMISSAKNRQEAPSVGSESIGMFDHLRQDCYEYLVKLAKEIALTNHIPNYASLFPNETLKEISNELPTTRDELLKVTGFTDFKFDRFDGYRFLDASEQYVAIILAAKEEVEPPAEVEEEPTLSETTSGYWQGGRGSNKRYRGKGRGNNGGSGAKRAKFNVRQWKTAAKSKGRSTGRGRSKSTFGAFAPPSTSSSGWKGKATKGASSSGTYKPGLLKISKQ